jgi:eukaryotic-like serine/threonine-protein kinase
MSGDDKDEKPPQGDRTVFMPSIPSLDGKAKKGGKVAEADDALIEPTVEPEADDPAAEVAGDVAVSEESASSDGPDDENAEPVSADEPSVEDVQPAAPSTIWAPSPEAMPEPAAEAASEPAAPPHPSTVWAPSPDAPGAGSVPPAGTGPTPSQAPFVTGVSNIGAGSGNSDHRRIQIGDVLNHIFEVRRFIGRGGMGEVFEGINVNTEERVAIKVILPHLAADPAVQQMFRKEARTLTRLSHPALVQYRVLAQEPALGALYIVTEFIDGPDLAGELSKLKPKPGQLVGLLRRLAQGLAAAHALGAIHRDISPDNIMLEGGKLEKAKVIDFGIAKDLEGAMPTVVGTGFAGKLNYVAPEQLGDFDRQVGPWTDVYSLGLAIFSASIGKDANMGATLVDAVDKRRAGVDISSAPAPLQPVLAAMLKANPAERLRSMEAVLEMLDSPDMAKLPGTSGFEPNKVLPGKSAGSGMSGRNLAIVGGGAVALLLAGGLAWSLMGSGGDKKTAASGTAADGSELAGPPAPPPADPVAAARKVAEASFATMPCSWLTLSNVTAAGNKVSLELRGVSGQSAAALDRIGKMLKQGGMEAGNIDFSDVSPIEASMCRPVESFNQIRDPGLNHLDVAQRKFEMDVLDMPEAGAEQGKVGARAVFNLDLSGLPDEMSLVGINESGEMGQITTNKAELVQASEAMGGERHRFSLFTTHTGWSGIMMLHGKPPFDAQLTGDSKARGPDWADKFLAKAKQQGWKAEMVWYKTVDEQPNKR